MGGFFGACRRSDAISDVFFGTDYHSHLGTKRAGMAAYDTEIGLQREIHNIGNSPFRTRFEHIFDEMTHFFSVYKTLENKTTVIDEAKGREEAEKIIEEAIERYKEYYGKYKFL